MSAEILEVDFMMVQIQTTRTIEIQSEQGQIRFFFITGQNEFTNQKCTAKCILLKINLYCCLLDHILFFLQAMNSDRNYKNRNIEWKDISYWCQFDRTR